MQVRIRSGILLSPECFEGYIVQVLIVLFLRSNKDRTWAFMNTFSKSHLDPTQTMQACKGTMTLKEIFSLEI